MRGPLVVDETKCSGQDGRLRKVAFWGAIALAAGLCLGAIGCESIGNLGAGANGTAPWLSTEAQKKTTTDRFRREVEADNFPTASQAGV